MKTRFHVRMLNSAVHVRNISVVAIVDHASRNLVLGRTGGYAQPKS
jgi:hypothetical protein